MQPVRPEPLLSAEDYGAIEAAVMETTRGRWFLAEYARRNRNADTEAVLAALRRLERLLQSSGQFEARDEVSRGMADIAQAIAAAQVSSGIQGELAAPADYRSETADAPAEAFAETLRQATKERLDMERAEPLVAGVEVTEPIALPADRPTEAEPVMEDVEFRRESVRVAEVAQTESAVVESAVQGAVAVESSMHPTAEATDAIERDVLGELESFLSEATPIPVKETPREVISTSALVMADTKMEVAAGELYPIIELDEEAAEALLTRDPPRQELILPTNHLLAQRWGRDLGYEPAQAGRSMRGPVGYASQAEEGLVIFVDEEPVEENKSVFSAPLRLEPEEAADAEPMDAVASLPLEHRAEEITPVFGASDVHKNDALESISEVRFGAVELAMAGAAGIVSPKRSPPAQRLTVGEIEAMSFVEKAAMFS